MDKIIISQLQIETIIGIYPHEREQKQPIIIDLEIDYDSRLAAKTDHISNALDYDKIVFRLQNYLQQNHFFLIETLANGISDILLTEFEIRGLRLTLYKPRAIPQANHVGLIIERSRELIIQ